MDDDISSRLKIKWENGNNIFTPKYTNGGDQEVITLVFGLGGKEESKFVDYDSEKKQLHIEIKVDLTFTSTDEAVKFTITTVTNWSGSDMVFSNALGVTYNFNGKIPQVILFMETLS